MSRILSIMSALGICNVDILKMALQIIAEEEGIEVGNSVKDYYGNVSTSQEDMKVVGSLATNALSNGIGVAVDKQKKLHFVGDSYNCQTAYNKLKERIELNYKKVNIALAYKALGYQVQEKTAKDGTTVFVGVK